MTDNEIIKKAINKAVKNGWLDESDLIIKPKEHYIKIKKDGGCIHDSEMFDDYKYVKIDSITSLIFSHPFAKAFWGEGTRYIDCIDIERGEHLCTNIKNWQYHLTKMVLEENPLQYLVEFLKDKEQ